MSAGISRRAGPAAVPACPRTQPASMAPAAKGHLADPVMPLCEKHSKAWTLANDSPDSDAFDVAEKIDLKINNSAMPSMAAMMRQEKP